VGYLVRAWATAGVPGQTRAVFQDPHDDDDEDVDALIDRGCDLAELGDHEQAVRLFRRAAAGGDRIALFDLGNSLSALGRWDEAISALQRAADAGERDAWLNLAGALCAAGRWLEAEGAARRALACGDRQGWAALADALHGQGRPAEAERALRGAAERGDPDAALQLAYELRGSGRQREAWHWAQLSADAGHPVAAGTLACWRWEETGDLALEAQLRAGAEVYDYARTALAALLRTTDRVEEARSVLEAGIAAGQDCWLSLGNLYLDELGDRVAAAAAYRAGIEAGDLHAHHNLGTLLLTGGDVDGAIEHFSIAAAGGDDLAAQVLREVLEED
jgi:tetratricopeptide (TPR) repeat protein